MLTTYHQQVAEHFHNTAKTMIDTIKTDDYKFLVLVDDNWCVVGTETCTLDRANAIADQYEKNTGTVCNFTSAG